MYLNYLFALDFIQYSVKTHICYIVPTCRFFRKDRLLAFYFVVLLPLFLQHGYFQARYDRLMIELVPV